MRQMPLRKALCPILGEISDRDLRESKGQLMWRCNPFAGGINGLIYRTRHTNMYFFQRIQSATEQ